MNTKEMKEISKARLITSNILFKTQFGLTDNELLIQPEDLENPNNPFPDNLILLGYQYFTNPIDQYNDLCTYYFSIPNQFTQQEQEQIIQAAANWLQYIYSEAWPHLKITKQEGFQSSPNTIYTITATQFC